MKLKVILVLSTSRFNEKLIEKHKKLKYNFVVKKGFKIEHIWNVFSFFSFWEDAFYLRPVFLTYFGSATKKHMAAQQKNARQFGPSKPIPSKPNVSEISVPIPALNSVSQPVLRSSGSQPPGRVPVQGLGDLLTGTWQISESVKFI